MQTTTARVNTPQAARLMQRLCKHWSHRFPVEVSDTRGMIDFGTSRCELLASSTDLQLNLQLSDGEDVVQLETIVADHLRRMANDESLEIQWLRSG